MESNKTIIEVNGVKLEVDLRTARRIDEIRVGTRVKVLRKEYSSHRVHHGVIIGFEPFHKLPTIIVAYTDIGYQTAKVEFLYYNADSKDVEIVTSNDDDVAALDKNDFLAQCDRELAKKQLEVAEINQKRAYFLDKFACYWRDVDLAVKDATT
jgi:hypothetical protein